MHIIQQYYDSQTRKKISDGKLELTCNTFNTADHFSWYKVP